MLMVLCLGIGNMWGATITWNTADNNTNSDVTIDDGKNATFTGDDASTVLTYTYSKGCKRLKNSGGLSMNGASQYNSSSCQRYLTFKAPSSTGTVSLTLASINGKTDGTGTATVRIYGGTTVAYDVSTLNSSLTSPTIYALQSGTSDIIITFSAKCIIKEVKWTDVAVPSFTTVYANNFTGSPMGVATVAYSSMSSQSDATSGWIGWASGYTGGYKSSSSSCSATLTFATPLELNSDGTDCGRIRIYWGHVSNNKNLGLKVNGSSVSFDPTTVANTLYPKVLNVAEYVIPKTTTTISSIAPSGSSSTGTYLFRIEVLTHSVTPTPAGDYDATFTSAKGTAPDNAEKIASITLEEITGVDGFKHVGWTANQAVTVDEAEVSVGTVIANGKTATLGANTAFTAVWKTEINPTLSYDKTMLVLTKLTTAAPTLNGNTGSGAVTWSSSATGVATVDESGNVTAVAAGATEITATIAANGDYAGGEAKATIKVVAAPTHLIENVLAVSGGWNSYIVTTDYSKISNLHEWQAMEGVNTDAKSDGGKSDRTGVISSFNTKEGEDADKYMWLSFDVAAGSALNISAVNLPVFGVSDNKTTYVVISDGVNEIAVDGSITANTDGNGFGTYDFSGAPALQGTVTMKMWAYGAINGYRMKSPIYIDGEIISTTPASGHAITKSATNGTIAVTDGTDAITSAEEGDEVFIAATPATGYGFTSWSVYKTGDAETTVTLADDDDTDNKTRKFTMPAYAVTVSATFTAVNYTLTWDNNAEDADALSGEYTSGAMAYGTTIVKPDTPTRSGYKFLGWAETSNGDVVDVPATMPAANKTYYAIWQEVTCPTSGTVFSLVMKSGLADEEVAAGTNLPLNSSYATVSGGTVTLRNNDTKDAKARIRNSEANFDGANAYIKVDLDCEMKIGDEITITSTTNENELWFTNTNSTSSKIETVDRKYTIIEDDILENKSVLYIWRKSGGTNVGTISITRPAKYAVTYVSEKGEAPSGVSAASVTLAEITGVSGWKNTGWKANVATEVGGESVDANTLIANGSVVTLSAATTFTAQWAELYTITTGSPANGSVAADKSSAVAGETITLTPTPEDGYKLSAWDVYKTGDATTKVSVTNNQFTMPAYGVTISGTFAESVVLYDYSVMAEAGNKSFTDEIVGENGESGKSKTFGTSGNPQLVVSNAGWDSKNNIINSFIKFFGGTSSMSVVTPTGRKATVTIKYGSYSADGKYLQVNGTNQAKPVANMSDDMTTETFGNYMRTVELTNQTGTLALTANASGNNLYIAYVDVTLTGYASYDITYYLNDGAWDGDAGAATYTYGTGIASLASNVTKTGCDFAGWYGNEGLTGDEITSIANNVTGDKELWAKWTPKSYTLTWDWDGGACSATAGEDYTAGGSVAYGAAITYPEASTMSKAGAAFAGWSTDAATMPAGALTITAQWAPSHAITYTEAKGATNSNPELYIEGIGIASFEPLVDVANFHFTGWSPASISAEATTDQTIVAQWVAAYNVSFDAGEGSGTVPATFQKWSGATVELPGQGEMVAPEGKIFVGWKANGAGDVLEAGDEYTMTAAAVEFVAQWKAVTLLINYDGENYSLNTTDFHTGVTLQDEIVASGYPTNAKFGNTCSAVTSIDNLAKAIIYHTKTNATKVTISAYNNYTGGSTGNLYYSVVEEGATSASVTTKGMTKESATTDYVVNMTGRSTLYIMCGHDIRICQVSVEENGTANKVAPEVGYSINLNKQRPLLLSGVATSFEGVEYKVASNFKPVNGQVQINALTNTYYKFTIPTGQTRQLQLTTSNTNKYVVSKTLGDNTESKKISGNQNINLTAGTWYINPQGSNVNITNIAFAATPDPLTVTFKDGKSTLSEQALFAGDKVVKPTDPTKDGYRFVEWQLSGSAYDFDDEVATDITLDAVWQEVVTITFAPANGESNFTKTADKGATLAAGDRPADPVYAGHVFQGWTRNTSADPVAYVNLASETFSVDATLTAVWEVAQTDATISALSYNGNAINVASAEDVDGVATYTVHLQWGTAINKDLISVTKTASSATVGTIAYDSEAKKATFTVTAGDGTTTADYAIQFVIDAKRGTSIVKAFVSGGDQKAGFAATGLYGDKGYANTRANKKLDTADKFVGVKLLSGETFEAGDKLYVVTSTDADRGYIEIYEEAAGTNLIKATGVRDASEGITVAELAGHNEFYIVRKESEGDQAWNGIVEYVEVTREMNPVIKSFKFGDDAATINESAKTISIDVPYGTDVTALTPTVEAYGNNGTTYTPDGATDFTSPVDYVVKDAYNEYSTTYTVTVNVAAPSENANLASLSVAGYALDFNKATTSYNVVLDYGTTVLPEITYAVEDAGLANAEKVEDGVNGATTITVTPQAGAGHEKVYTINFTVSTTPKFVIYDGSTMTDYAESGSDVGTGFAWSVTGGNHSAKNINVTLNGKTYTKAQNVFTSATKGENAGNTRFIEITIPEGYVAKFYLAGATNDDGSIRSSYISKEKTGTLDESIAYASTDSYDGAAMRSGYQMPGTYYYCSDASIRLYELSVTLYPAHMRNATVGKMATVCLRNNVEADGIIGAEVYELLYWKYGTSYADCQMVDFGEVTSMAAGHAYLFIPTADKVAFVLGNNVAPAPVVVSGFTGTYEPIAAAYDNVLTGKYGVVNNMIQKLGHNCYSAANRAYIDLSQTPSKDAYDAQPHMTNHAPRKRVSLGHKITTEEEPIATGLDAINVENADVQKVLINGEMFIIRDGHIYSATGMMVK